MKQVAVVADISFVSGILKGIRNSTYHLYDISMSDLEDTKNYLNALIQSKKEICTYNSKYVINSYVLTVKV